MEKDLDILDQEELAAGEIKDPEAEEIIDEGRRIQAENAKRAAKGTSLNKEIRLLENIIQYDKQVGKNTKENEEKLAKLKVELAEIYPYGSIEQAYEKARAEGLIATDDESYHGKSRISIR